MAHINNTYRLWTQPAADPSCTYYTPYDRPWPILHRCSVPAALESYWVPGYDAAIQRPAGRLAQRVRGNLDVCPPRRTQPAAAPLAVLSEQRHT